MSQEPSKVALVTGGSRGIGRATVEVLLAEGFRVWFCGLSRGGLENARRRLAKRYPGAVHARTADVRRQDAVDGLVEAVLEREGRIDCLVNNAGLGYFAPVDEISGDDWRRVLETNLNGSFYLIRAVAPIMKKQGSGYIVNVLSLAARNAFAGGAAYNASKFGFLGLSDATMLDLRDHGIRVTAILPGSVATDFMADQPGDHGWMLQPMDVARGIRDLLRYPERAIPSRLELRPARPPR